MRPRKKFGNLSLIMIAVLSISALLWAGLWLTEDGQRQGLPSLYSGTDSGFMAVFQLLKKTFPHVYPGENDLSYHLQSEPGVFITARTEWSNHELKEALRWMEKGGVVIQLTPHADELSRRRPSRLAMVNPEWTGFSDLSSISLKSSPGLILQPGDVALYTSTDGAEIGVRKIGKGRRVVFGVKEGLTNASLRKNPQLAAVLVKLVALYQGNKRRITWDESFNIPKVQHRFKFPQTWSFILIQFIIIGLAYTITQGRRLGPAIPWVEHMPLTLRDYLTSLAGFYRRTRSRRWILETLFSDLRLRLIRRTGLSPSVDDRRLAEAYASMEGHDPEHLRRLMEDCRRYLSENAMDEKTFYQLGKLIDRYRKELEQHGEC